MTKSDRLAETFARLNAEKRGALVTFVTAGDPDLPTSTKLLQRLPGAGADIIELGMPFSDPMADGPAIQAANLRALKQGASLAKTLEMVSTFRTEDEVTPIILMGYFNPIYQYGVSRFVNDATQAGVDGLILVDLPVEEDAELCDPARTGGLHWIRLVTPTTDEKRLSTVLRNSSGFVYHVSIAGITGTRSGAAGSIDDAVTRLRRHTSLPIAVGFGIKTSEQVAAITKTADAAVVGSAIINVIEANLDDQGQAEPALMDNVCTLVTALAQGARN